MDLQKEFEKRFKVRVDVPDTCTRNYLCGSARQADAKGMFFIIPAAHKDYTSKIMPQYTFSEPFEDEPKKGRKPKDSE